MGELNAASYLHTFPRQHGGGGHGRGSVSATPTPTAECPHPSMGGFDTIARNAVKGERRKTVTFLGEVETIRCDERAGQLVTSRGGYGAGAPAADSARGGFLPTADNPRGLLLSPTSTVTTTSSDADDYVESRV